MTDYYPQESTNYLYAPGRQWNSVRRTVTVSESPLINIDYDEDGELFGIEVCW